MKEYKVIKTRKRKAEYLMNEMTKQGWEVVSVNYWNWCFPCLLITFSRDK